MTSSVRAAIGLTLYNNARYLPEALGSILAQTYKDFSLVLLDDGSTDESEAIARRYAKGDPRVLYLRHERRQGMIATWRHAFELARQVSPAAEYFAWASDHDLWHPKWLRTLVAVLDEHSEVVLAYPRSRRVDAAGELIDKPVRVFETFGLADVTARWKRLCHEGIGAGDMVYGLVRVPALAAAGVFRDVLRPDRLLMAELALQGQFRQVPEVLWFRRQVQLPSVLRQRRTLFADDAAPATVWFPPWVVHGAALFGNYVWRTPERPIVTRRRMTMMTLRYMVSSGLRHFRKSLFRYRIGIAIDGILAAWKWIRHAVLLGVYHVLVASKPFRDRFTGLRH